MKIIKVKYDIIIIGAGIVGLAHAIAALEQGKSVLLLEHNHKSMGASIQNFGLIWPVGQPPGDLFDRAMKSREKWLEISQKSGFWVSDTGSLHLAYNRFEWDVFQEYHTRFGYKTSLLTPSKVAERYPHINTNGLSGALYSTTELTTDPGKAVYAITTWLSMHPDCDLHFNERALHIEQGRVHTAKSVYEADEVLVCSGADTEYLFPLAYEDSGVVKCKLQMMRTQPLLQPTSIGPTLASGLSLKRFSSFAQCSSYPALSEYITRELPDLDKHGINVLITQNRELQLILGHSLEFGKNFDPFLRADVNQLILNYVKRMVNFPLPALQQSWYGVYAEVPGRTELVLSPQKNVTIINGFGGAGMTMAFGFAQEFFETMP